MTDPNHDIVPTLRMFDGVMTGLAADEIERLRKRVAELEADAEAEPTMTSKLTERQRMDLLLVADDMSVSGDAKLADALRALLAAHPGQLVADDAAVRGGERAKRKAFTAVFLDVTTDEASEIVNHPKWSAGSWSHALDDRDAARAELARATSSQAHPGQPEPRECRHCGWMCIPNSTPSTTHYPLPQPEPSGEVMAFTTTVGRLLATAPHFEECETPEPCLSALIHRYYENYFDREKGREYAELYIAALYEAARAQGGEKS
ncbi:hypothetical protein [Burkholderia multivorans]|uniref:hypothetical protein n=1 Tax=Burkholderia multivorans TaxID=87883 RepID=UPI000CFE870C|nr:hypothetical protein [Burkholderia multivorans]PRH19111.1 hypothetical protein C6T71_24475 [Burkholderia multivorans]